MVGWRLPASGKASLSGPATICTKKAFLGSIAGSSLADRSVEEADLRPVVAPIRNILDKEMELLDEAGSYCGCPPVYQRPVTSHSSRVGFLFKIATAGNEAWPLLERPDERKTVRH
jgi:hypothetical protein